MTHIEDLSSVHSLKSFELLSVTVLFLLFLRVLFDKDKSRDIFIRISFQYLIRWNCLESLKRWNLLVQHFMPKDNYTKVYSEPGPASQIKNFAKILTAFSRELFSQNVQFSQQQEYMYLYCATIYFWYSPWITYSAFE